MALNGETLRTGMPRTCEECGVGVVEHVMKSAAGYYIGTACECGPYSRESGYYKNSGEAEKALKEGNYGR